MRNALLIAVREFLDNVQTRGFWFGILLVPLLWLMASQVPLILRNLTSTDKPVDPMAPAEPDTAP